MMGANKPHISVPEPIPKSRAEKKVEFAAPRLFEGAEAITSVFSVGCTEP